MIQRLRWGESGERSRGGARPRSLGAPGSFLAELLEVVVLAVGLYLVITFAVQTVHVLGLSMYPTLHNDDYLIASKLDYRLHQPQRGDIVILKDPFDESKDFIKRVVAVPGDRLRIRDGRVYVNGRLQPEPYLRSDEAWTVANNWPPNGSADGEVIPQGLYFVMGDNRNHSSDSRTFGPIRSSEIEAKAWIRIWPADRLGAIRADSSEDSEKSSAAAA